MNNNSDEYEYIRKLYMEAIFPYNGNSDRYSYVYVTYDNKRLKGFQRNNLSNYNVQAWARIPINKNVFVDMRLFTGKDDKMLEFTMQCFRYTQRKI